MGYAQSIIDEIGRRGIVPVVSESDPEKAMRLCDALVAGGLPVAEITLRGPGALDALRAVAERDDLLPIAGTVLTEEQVDASVDAGARLIVSPGFSLAVVRRAAERGVAVCPGVCTPSDVQAAYAAGLSLVKFFPAEAAGGIKTLRALAAPFPAMRFLPTGGLNSENLPDYLSLPTVLACGGSWMVAPGLYEDGDYRRVEQATSEAVSLVRDTRASAIAGGASATAGEGR